VHQRAGQTQLLLHSPGEIPGQPAFERREVAERQEPVDPFLAPAAGHLVDVGVEVDVLQDRQVGIEPEPLAHVADVLLDRLGVAHHVVASHPGVARRRVHDRRQQAHGGGLAGAIRSDQTMNFAGGQHQVDAGQGRDIPK